MSLKVTNECDICCELFNKTNHSKTVCGHCYLSVCKTCVRNYLLNTTSLPHCMKCKKPWNREITQKSITKSYYNSVYKEKRKDMLFETEKARFPETMPAVENYKNIANMKSEKIKLDNFIIELEWQLDVAKGKSFQIKNKINRAKNGQLVEKDKKQFIRKCPRDNCEGFLSSSWKCGVCNVWACSKCFGEKGFNKDDEHTCNPDDVASAELIKKETKPCPSCGTRIFKISGCDQMWCTGCHVAFSWKTGLKVNGVIHNPHFYQYQKEGGGAVIQNPGAQICGGLPGYHRLRLLISNCRRRVKSNLQVWTSVENHFINNCENMKNMAQYNPSIFMGFTNTIMSILRGAQHFQHVIIDDIRIVCQRGKDNTSLRIQFICGEITEKSMKKTLLTRDNKLEKQKALLDIYELMMVIYTETLVYFERTIEEFNTLYKKDKDELISGGKLECDKIYKIKLTANIQKLYKNIVWKIEELEKVRKYCNKELCKISGVYNQAVSLIDGRYETPRFNKDLCKEELKKKNCGTLNPVVSKRDDGTYFLERYRGRLIYA